MSCKGRAAPRAYESKQKGYGNIAAQKSKQIKIKMPQANSTFTLDEKKFILKLYHQEFPISVIRRKFGTNYGNSRRFQDVAEGEARRRLD